jgi:hypothetical protein
MASFAGDEQAPAQEKVESPEEYRARIGEVRKGARAASKRYRKKADAWAFAAIVLTTISSAIGFVTAAVKEPALGIAAGVTAALGAAVTAWQRRRKYDKLAAANRKLDALLDREITEYDTKAGIYQPDPTATDGAAKAADDLRRFRLFVPRCEAFSADANRSIDDPAAA